MPSRLLARSIAHLALLFIVPACPAQIGDPCQLSTDCGRTTIRHCDLSARVDGEGECIVDGCDHESCPDEATCVASYATEFVSKACDPLREDLATCAVSVDEGEICPQTLPPLDDCSAPEICLAEGLCIDTLSQRTSCRATCKRDRECRAGYTCRSTGANGIYRVVDPKRPNLRNEVQICVPES